MMRRETRKCMMLLLLLKHRQTNRARRQPGAATPPIAAQVTSACHLPPPIPAAVAPAPKKHLNSTEINSRTNAATTTASTIRATTTISPTVNTPHHGTTAPASSRHANAPLAVCPVAAAAAAGRLEMMRPVENRRRRGVRVSKRRSAKCDAQLLLLLRGTSRTSVRLSSAVARETASICLQSSYMHNMSQKNRVGTGGRAYSRIRRWRPVAVVPGLWGKRNDGWEGGSAWGDDLDLEAEEIGVIGTGPPPFGGGVLTGCVRADRRGAGSC